MKYLFLSKVEESVGTVLFEVDGSTEQEAQANLDAGKGRLVFDQIELKRLSKPAFVGFSSGKTLGLA